MSTVVVIDRVLLAAIFAVAALTKLRDPAGSRRAVREFGVPGGLAAPVALFLPLAELGIAGGLSVSGSARWAAAGACVLLGGFALAIALNLARGRRPSCNCFGQVHSRPVSAVTLLRNIVLLGLAAVVVVHPSGLGTSVAIALAIFAGVALQAWVAVQLLRQNGRILVRLAALEQPAGAQQPSGVAIGSPAPNFVLQAVDGATFSMPSLLARGRALLLVFVSPGCGPCDALLPLVAVWQQRFSDQLTTAIISAGTLTDNQALAAEHQVERLLIQPDGEVAASYGVTATPSVLLIDEQGRFASEFAAGQDAIVELVADVVRGSGNQGQDGASVQAPVALDRPPVNARAAAALGAATLLATVGSSATAQAADADRQAISALLAQAGPSIDAHARTLSAAGKRFSRKVAAKPAVRSAALQTVARQRQDFIDLRDAVSKAAASTPQASYAKQLVIDSLNLLAAAFQKIEDSLRTRNPKLALRALRDGWALFSRALQRSVDAEAALKAP